MELRLPAQRAHRLAELGLDERVDDDRLPPFHPLHRELQVGDRLDARVPDLAELLVGELRLERLHEPRRRLAGRIGDHVQLDEAHRRTLEAFTSAVLNRRFMRLSGVEGTLCAVKHLLGLAAASIALVLPLGRSGLGRRRIPRATPPAHPCTSRSRTPTRSTRRCRRAGRPTSGSLPHGPELSRLTLDLLPLGDVQSSRYCGSQALACYDPATRDDLRDTGRPARRASRAGDRDARVRPPHRDRTARTRRGRRRTTAPSAGRRTSTSAREPSPARPRPATKAAPTARTPARRSPSRTACSP